MTYIIVFFTAWAIFIIFADKKRIYRLFPSSLAAMVMSLSSDLITTTYPLWVYHDNETHLSRLVIELLDDFGIYPVIAYLYVQFLPSTLRLKSWVTYTFIWTLGGILCEYIILHQGYMSYGMWWNLVWSYCADWVIFCILTAVYLRVQRQLEHPTIELMERKAHVSYNVDIQPLPPEHPLQFIPEYPGTKFFKGVSGLNIETYIFLLKPNATHPTHQHAGYEMHHLVEGSAVVTVDGQAKVCQQGDLIHFSSMLPHSFENRSTVPAKFISTVILTPPNLEPLTTQSNVSRQSG